VSDDPGIQSDPVTPSETPAQPKRGIRGFLSTTVGKVVAGCLGAAILLAIVTVIVLLALGAFGLNFLNSTANQAGTGQGSVIVATSTVIPSTGATSTATGTVKPSVSATPDVVTVTDDDVFTPRDPFVPVVLPSAPPTSTASTDDGSSSGTSSSSSIPSITSPDSNMLYYVMALGTNSGPLAALDYKGVVYELAPGGVIPNSPWKVLSIDSTSKTVTMLYGDERVTISLGEGIQSK
jgi:hypothetical protein